MISLETALIVCGVGVFMLWRWASSEQQKAQEKIESLQKLQESFGRMGKACGQMSNGMSNMARAVEKIGGVLVLAVGDLVKVSSDEETVRSSIGSTGYKWDDQISGMLGKTFPVLAVEGGSKGDMVALPSPDGGKFFFSTEVLRRDEKAEAKRQFEEKTKLLLQKSTDAMNQVEEMLSKTGLTGKERTIIQASLEQLQDTVKELTAKQEQAPPRAPESVAEDATCKSN